MPQLYPHMNPLRPLARRHLGVPAVNLDAYKIPPRVLALLPAEFCREAKALPLNEHKGRLILVVQDPADETAARRAREITGLPVDVCVAGAAQIEKHLERYFGSA